MKTEQTKSEVTHSPGPWRVWRDMDPKEPRQIVGLCGEPICYIEEADTQATQNARLIAAAPEMLDAMSRIANGQFDGHVSSIEQVAALRQVARAAIARAEGRVE